MIEEQTDQLKKQRISNHLDEIIANHNSNSAGTIKKHPGLERIVQKRKRIMEEYETLKDKILNDPNATEEQIKNNLTILEINTPHSIHGFMRFIKYMEIILETEEQDAKQKHEIVEYIRHNSAVDTLVMKYLEEQKNETPNQREISKYVRNVLSGIGMDLGQKPDFSLTAEDILGFYPHILTSVGLDRQDLTVAIATTICARYSVNGSTNSADAIGTKRKEEFAGKFMEVGELPELYSSEKSRSDSALELQKQPIPLGANPLFLKKVLRNLEALYPSIEEIRTALLDFEKESCGAVRLEDKGLRSSIGSENEGYYHRDINEELARQGGTNKMKNLQNFVDVIYTTFTDFTNAIQKIQLPVFRSLLDTTEEDQYHSGGHSIYKFLKLAGFDNPAYEKINISKPKGSSKKLADHGILIEKYAHPHTRMQIKRSREYELEYETPAGPVWNGQTQIRISDARIEIIFGGICSRYHYTPGEDPTSSNPHFESESPWKEDYVVSLLQQTRLFLEKDSEHTTKNLENSREIEPWDRYTNRHQGEDTVTLEMLPESIQRRTWNADELITIYNHTLNPRSSL